MTTPPTSTTLLSKGTATTLVDLSTVDSILETPDGTIDFLAILLDSLAAYPDHYRVAGRVVNTVAEAPAITPSYDLIAVRLTDQDVLLARDGVATTTVAERNYAVELPLPIGIVVKRGYIVVDAAVQGRGLRFAATHLEDGLLEAQLAETAELIQVLDASTAPVVIAGDLNSRAPSGPSVQMLLAAGYRDAWLASPHGDDPGMTCCQDADLANDVSHLRSRIDFILDRGLDAQRVRAWTVGDTGEEKTASGLWPSDHAGVGATYSMR